MGGGEGGGGRGSATGTEKIHHLKLLQRGKGGQHRLTKVKMQRGLAQRGVRDAPGHAQTGSLGQQVVRGRQAAAGPTHAAAAAAASNRWEGRRAAGIGGCGGRRQRMRTAGPGQSLETGIAGRRVVQAGLRAFGVGHRRDAFRRQGGSCEQEIIFQKLSQSENPMHEKLQ